MWTLIIENDLKLAVVADWQFNSTNIYTKAGSATSD